jgi:biopolymer transport protein ExbB
MWSILKQGGVAMYPLGACSLLILAVAIERWAALRRERWDVAGFLDRARAGLSRGRDEALRLCREEGSSLGDVAALAFEPDGSPDTVAAGTAARVEALERPLAAIGTVAAIAPFIGLFGTVIGIMRAFRDVSRYGGAAAGRVSTGISEALVATASGLFVAIVATILYNYFVAWVGRIASELDLAARRVVDMAREGGPQ